MHPDMRGCERRLIASGRRNTGRLGSGVGGEPLSLVVGMDLAPPGGSMVERRSPGQISIGRDRARICLAFLNMMHNKGVSLKLRQNLDYRQKNDFLTPARRRPQYVVRNCNVWN